MASLKLLSDFERKPTDEGMSVCPGFCVEMVSVVYPLEGVWGKWHGIGHSSEGEPMMTWFDAIDATERSWYTDRAGWVEVSEEPEGRRHMYRYQCQVQMSSHPWRSVLLHLEYSIRFRSPY